MTRSDHSLPLAPVDPDPEFAPGVDQPPAELDRRRMIQLLAAGAALAGLGPIAGCMQKPSQRIMPRVDQAPELVPGVALDYATATVIDGYATGVVVVTHEARPTKVEGNPDHPASLGATTVFDQASVLQLYDPNRATGALDRGTPAELATLVRQIAGRERMPGLWFLLHPQSSPLIEDAIARIRARHPGARFVFDTPVSRRAVFDGARLVFGRALEPQYRFDVADAVVALDADFLAAMPGSVRWSRDFATRRRVASPGADMSRLYTAEPRPTPTGSLADHPLAVRGSELRAIAAALLAAVEGRALEGVLPGARSERARRWVAAAARDLRTRRGLVVVGDRQPREVHALGHLINHAIGAIGTTVMFTRPAVLEPLGDDLAALAAALAAGRIQTLVIAEANPLYTAPPDLGLATNLPRVPELICADLAESETSRGCHWFVPLAHAMESWGDARGYDGTITFVQPLIQPLHAGITLLELLSAFAGDPEPDGHRLLRARYAPGTTDDATAAWQAALQRGAVAGSAFALEVAAIRLGDAERAALVAPAGDPAPSPLPGSPQGPIELAFEPSPAVYDGRFAAIPWLQELPKPLDKITWGNAARMSRATAAELGVRDHDVVRIVAGGATATVPVFILPGHADRCVSLELGYGRWAAGPVGDGVGSNVYPLRSSARPWFAPAAAIAATGERQPLAVTQEHERQHGRPIALAAALDDYRRDPDFTQDHWQPEPTMLAPQFETFFQWGMTIDTMICSGCSACVIACQAENNVPSVGAEGVRRNREMHWLRIDTYREGRADDPRFIHQPMLCQHCANAPCEYVCPVYATQHSPDGLNEMIYNRCIGTRFCSNNCPYKVRRFNWFDFTEGTPPIRQLQYNPNVTVRSRGVMEKCTYCVQRIRAADIAARKDRRDIRPGEVVTACQQACPTGAIQFGRLDHEQTLNVQWRGEHRHYAVLNQLGTRPKTVYLAKIWNPSPDLPVELGDPPDPTDPGGEDPAQGDR
jgi:molybdopterin-containing oxidoreductase family iron-sulfur binding subunit